MYQPLLGVSKMTFYPLDMICYAGHFNRLLTAHLHADASVPVLRDVKWPVGRSDLCFDG